MMCVNQWTGDLEPVKYAVWEVLKDDSEDGRNIIIEDTLTKDIRTTAIK
jgi:hypothetical protein